jgi:ABC-type uncharacterized transport system ATPase subunit
VTPASLAARTAVTAADDAFHTRLRGRFGLTPRGAPLDAYAAVAYCGREFRVYPSMRVGEAVRFYAALHERWNAEALRDDLERTNLGDDVEVRRMKRAYQRALVLALALATEPELLVVESAHEFDEPAAAELLGAAVRRVPRALVTYEGEATPPNGEFGEIVAAARFDVTWT